MQTNMNNLKSGEPEYIDIDLNTNQSINEENCLKFKTNCDNSVWSGNENSTKFSYQFNDLSKTISKPIKDISSTMDLSINAKNHFSMHSSTDLKDYCTISVMPLSNAINIIILSNFYFF